MERTRRRHHNNTGYQTIRRGKTVVQVKRMAEKIRQEKEEIAVKRIRPEMAGYCEQCGKYGTVYWFARHKWLCEICLDLAKETL